jgi:hypothetical protein
MRLSRFLPIAALCPAMLWAQGVALTPQERAIGEAEVSIAARYFADSLREPSSAVFRNVFIGKRPIPTPKSKIVVCGEVNARNGFGGMTGFQAFIVSGDSVYVGKVIGLSVYETCRTDRVFDTRDYSADLQDGLRGAAK